MIFFYRPDSLDRHYLCLKSPKEDEEPDTSNLDVDYEYFEKEMWSDLAHRVPAFEEAKVICDYIIIVYFEVKFSIMCAMG